MSFLGLDEFFEVTNLKLIEPEEWQIGEYAVHNHIISVEWSIYLVKNLCENFKEFFVTYASVEHLFNKDFLIGIFNLNSQEINFLAR